MCDVQTASPSVTCASALQSSSTTNDVESPLVEDSTQSPTAEHTSPATAEAEPQHSEGTASTTASQSTSSASEIRGSASTPRTPMVGSRVSRGPRPVFQPDEDGVDGPAATIDGTLVPEASRWFRNGDVVVGKILWSNNRGARVQLVADPRITACVFTHSRTPQLSLIVHPEARYNYSRVPVPPYTVTRCQHNCRRF